MTPEFIEFPKIARYSREVIVTEKIDGTNGQVYITEDGRIFAGSRTRWVTPEQDNYGFAKWVEAHRDELLKLGPGSHFGEWWGHGVQRKYGLLEKRFSLFNVERWGDPVMRPVCCHVVPVLWRGPFEELDVPAVLEGLVRGGSIVSPGFMKPEGIIIYHVAGRLSFKKTIEKDAEPKSKVAA